MKFKFKRFIHTIESIILSIRFPFLYPRNRFSGRHYVSDRITSFHIENWNKAFEAKPVNQVKLKYDKYGYLKHNRVLELFNIKDGQKTLAIKILVLDFIEKYILSIFHCIPTYNELDAMPDGWRKAFGIEMCKEIKKELKKYHYLYKYRIMQIKEKYGELRWYDGGYPSDSKIEEIIEKYTDLSYETCIVCGKKAKYLTLGWIAPFCEDCVPKDRKIEEIKYGRKEDDEDSRAF